MAFSILDYITKLEPSDHSGKYICPACNGNDLSVNEKTGAYNCFNDPSAKHRAEIRNILAPLERWERPLREPASYIFSYQNRKKETVLNVLRNDTSGKKEIRQSYPTVPSDAAQRKTLIDEVRGGVLPYRYYEAMEASNATGLPIFVVEGELTCDRLWEIGLPSVTFLGGSGQYRANGDYSQLFRGKALVLCPDRDEPGVALMCEVAADNPGSQWCYADPSSFEWESLPQKGGYDLSDWIDDGADQETILSSIVSKNRHEGKDGLPSYEEIISTFERMVGLYGNDARVAFEATQWLEKHGVKMSQQNVDKILDEAKARLFGKEEIQTIDALDLVNDDSVREWLIAGIVPLGSVTLLAAQGGTGKAQPMWAKVLTPDGWKTMGELKKGDEVIAGDGSVTKVTGVFPQGRKPIFKVQMNDGATTYCCDDHLWLTKTQQQRDEGSRWSVKSLKQIRESLYLHNETGHKSENHSIPIMGENTLKDTGSSIPIRFINSVRHICDDEAQCISVASPTHTYVTDDFIVTHNTSLMYNWAMSVATGGKWSGRRCIKGKCLLISADEPLSDTKEKLAIIGYQDAGIEPGMVSFWETWRFAHIQQLEAFVRRHRPVFIVIDSLTACFAGMNVDLIKSNAGDSLYALRDLANVYQCSIVILHHLNRQGGLRDSSSFVDNVSEVVKLYRQDGNYDNNQFVLEWVKSRSGLTGKHILQRRAMNYGWEYGGPLGNSIEDLDKVANYVNLRPHSRFSSKQVAIGSGLLETLMASKLLEMARRQGLITSSFASSPDGTLTRMYHSFDYQEPDLDFPPSFSPSEETEDHDFF